jgi:Kef-type K+ transport system membrane component KefB
MTWRESGAVGSLMGEFHLGVIRSHSRLTVALLIASACKGLVELIVLNIGLNAGVLNLEVFAIFVMMAIIR